MVEPITLGVIVATLVAKAVGRAEDKALDRGLEIVRKALDTLRERFTGSDDKAGLEALDRLVDAPDSPSRVRELAGLVDQRAGESSELREELEMLVREANEAGIGDSISQVAIGNQIVQNDGLINSQVDVRQVSPHRSRE